MTLFPTHKRSILFFIFYLFSASLFAQPESIKFTHFNAKDGLSQNSVHSILQDSKGFLWIGTKDGINRYDGYGFKHYKHNYNDTLSLSDNFIRSIYEDKQERLWIGTEYGGLNFYNREKDKFIPVVIKKNNKKLK